jgi:hypothetical protein
MGPGYGGAVGEITPRENGVGKSMSLTSMT